MKEHGIIFSAPMVQAILAGRKTQTRRIMVPQPSDKIPDTHKQWIMWGNVLSLGDARDDEPECEEEWTCAYVGRLWVRETACFQLCDRKKEKVIHFRADGHELEDSKVWTPSIFMPRWASRITLEVLSVRVERLQDITEDDAKAEGCDPIIHEDGAIDCGTRKTTFSKLWDSIYGHTAWDKNPWVWKIEFKRLDTCNTVVTTAL